MRQLLKEATRTVDASLYWDEESEVIYRGEREIYAQEDLIGASRRVLRHGRNPSVALIGLGTGTLARMWPRPLTIYELEQCIIDLYEARFPGSNHRFVVGDYRDTLAGEYDVILYDGGEVPDERLLRAHLAPGGVLEV